MTRNYTGPWPRTPSRLLGTALVRLYQLTFSSFVGGHCKHLPTCSEYAYEAIARHGLFVGAWLSAKRVARCGPFGTAGIDPVPDRSGSFRRVGCCDGDASCERGPRAKD